jgi:hypothetical protein
MVCCLVAIANAYPAENANLPVNDQIFVVSVPEGSDDLELAESRNAKQYGGYGGYGGHYGGGKLEKTSPNFGRRTIMILRSFARSLAKYSE